MSCRISFDTELYDDTVNDYLKLVPAIQKSIQGTKSIYRFFNYHGYVVEVDEVLKEIAVYTEKDIQIVEKAMTAHGHEWKRVWTEKGLVKENPATFIFEHISSDKIMELIMQMIRTHVQTNMEDDIGLRNGKIKNLSLTYTLPYALQNEVKHGLLTRKRGSLESLDVYQMILPSKLYPKVVDFNLNVLKQGRHRSTLETVNFYWAHAVEIDEIKNKFPRLYEHLNDYYYRGFSAELFTYDYQGRLQLLTAQSVANDCPTDWHRRRKSLITDLRAFVMRKLSLSRSELAEWLVLDEQKFNWITRYGGRMGHGVALQVIREVGRTPAMTGLDSLDTFYSEVHRRAADKAFLRQLVVEALKNSIKRRHRMGISQWLELEWNQVSDWFRAVGSQFVPDKNQRTAKWSWFVRHSEEWHDQAAIAKMETKDPMAVWTSLLPQHVFGEYMFVPMLSDHDLIIEGESQHHCVGGQSYVNNSVSGEHLIWSIRTRENNRVATLQLKRKQDQILVNDYVEGRGIIKKSVTKSTWERRACLGKRNSVIEPLTSAAADELIARYNAKFTETWRIERKDEEERVKLHKAEESEKHRYQAKLAARIEKLMREEGMTRLDARNVAVANLEAEAVEKAAKAKTKAEAARKHLDVSGRIILRVDEHEDDEVPPATEDADPDWVHMDDTPSTNLAVEYLGPVTLHNDDGTLTTTNLYTIAGNPPDEPAPQQLPELVVDFELEEAQPLPAAPDGMDELAIRLADALAAAFDELPPLTNQEVPHPIEVAA